MSFFGVYGMDYRLLMGGLLVALSLVPGTARAQSTRVQFDVRYGAKLERVALTGEYDDDMKLAAEMLADARREGETTAMVTLICEHVYKTGAVFPSGYALGIEAMDFLGDRIKSKRLSSLSMATSLQQKLFYQANESNRKERGEKLIEMIVEMANYEIDNKRWNGAEMYYAEAINTADEIASPKRSQILAQLSKMEAMQYVSNLKDRFERDSTDSKAVEGLMRLYVIELDNPKEALPYQYSTSDLSMQKYVELATRELDQLIGVECLELGDWYVTLIDRATPGGKSMMRARAKKYYDSYLKLHRTNDASRQRVIKAIDDLGVIASSPPGAPSFSPAPPTAAPPPKPTAIAPPPATDITAVVNDSSAKGFEQEEGWIDLLAPVDLIKHVGRGVWDFKDGDLIAEPPTPAQVTTPFEPKGDYIVEARFTRVSVGGSAAFHLPVGEKQVMLLLGERRRRQRDYIVGLDIIDGNPATENDTALPLELKTAELYTVRIEVIGGAPDVFISVTLNDEPLLDWIGEVSSLGTSTEWTKFAPHALGVGADGGGTIQYHGARLMMVSGEATPLP